MKRNESWTEFMNRAKKNGLSPTRQEEVDREEIERTDTDRLNFLQDILKGNVVCRNSTKGRGFRLHQYRGESYKSFQSVRKAIDHYMDNKSKMDGNRCKCKEPDVMLGFYDTCKKCKKLL